MCNIFPDDPNGVREEHSKYKVGDFVQRRNYKQ